MKSIIEEHLKKLKETYGQEGISKKIAELTHQKEILVSQRSEITAKINSLDKEIKKWTVEISPNQTSMF